MAPSFLNAIRSCQSRERGTSAGFESDLNVGPQLFPTELRLNVGQHPFPPTNSEQLRVLQSIYAIDKISIAILSYLRAFQPEQVAPLSRFLSAGDTRGLTQLGEILSFPSKNPTLTYDPPRNRTGAPQCSPSVSAENRRWMRPALRVFGRAGSGPLFMTYRRKVNVRFRKETEEKMCIQVVEATIAGPDPESNGNSAKSETI
ncbi:hypothetical protein B0H14DRAFT_2603302 [Mycena olivaceomarginata]|nr:hypothetical protein B0H14DRAFT_2603302 [Mycena olivaceomarginata]